MTKNAYLLPKKTFVTPNLLIQAKEAVSSQCFDSLYRKEEKPCLDGQVSALILLESKVEGKPCPGSEFQGLPRSRALKSRTRPISSLQFHTRLNSHAILKASEEEEETTQTCWQ